VINCRRNVRPKDYVQLSVRIEHVTKKALNFDLEKNGAFTSASLQIVWLTAISILVCNNNIIKALVTSKAINVRDENDNEIMFTIISKTIMIQNCIGCGTMRHGDN